MMAKLEKNKILFFLINLCAGGYFFLINYLTPLAGDDFIFSNIFGTTERVKNISDVIYSQRIQYMTWGGRSIVHAIDQFFLIYDKIFFDVANTIVFMMLVLMIYYCVYRTCISNSFLLLLYAALWFAIPGVGMSIVWQTMSCNYLWGSALVFACFMPYFLSLQRGTVLSGLCKKIVCAVGMLVLGFVSGWTIEAGGAMLLAGMVFVMGYFIFKHHHVPAWQISGFVGAIMGYMVLILAPGNYERTAVVKGIVPNRNILYELIFRIARETYYMIRNMGWLFLIVVALVIIIKKNDSWVKFAKENLDAVMMFGLSLIGIYVMTAAVAYAERVLVTPIIFATAAGGLLYKKWNKNCNSSLRTCVVCFACIIMCTQAAAAAYQMRSGDRMLDIRTEYTSLHGGKDR